MAKGTMSGVHKELGKKCPRVGKEDSWLALGDDG